MPKLPQTLHRPTLAMLPRVSDQLACRIVADIQHVLDPDHQPGASLAETEGDGVVYLWSPERGPLRAGVNYGDHAEAG